MEKSCRDNWLFPILISVLLVAAFIIRLPHLNRDLGGWHEWKSIRHHQMAQSMLELHDPLHGYVCYTQGLNFTEAPLVDWTLMLVYSIFGATTFNLRLTFVTLNVFTILLFFLVVRRLTDPWFAIAGSFIFLTMPFFAFYCSHAFGENFVYSGQILFLCAGATLLQRNFKWKNLALFFAASLFLSLGKLSSGLIAAIFGFYFVNLNLYFMHREKILRFAKSNRIISAALFILYFGLPLLPLAKFIKTFYFSHGKAHLLLLSEDFYRRFGGRWVQYIGTYLLIFTLVSLAFYFLWFLIKQIRRSGTPFSAFERMAIYLFAANGLQTVLQARGFHVHHYYSNTWIIPSVFLVVCFFYRLKRRSAAAFLVALFVFLYFYAPSYGHYSRKLFELCKQGQIKREKPMGNLARFFDERKKTTDKYYIFARDPNLTYFAGTHMILRWSWDILASSLRKELKEYDDYVNKYNIDFVMYRADCIPDEIKRAAWNDPLIDLGEDYYKLGLMVREKGYYIFKITNGITRREPLENGDFSTGDFSGWIPSGDVFSLENADDGFQAVSEKEGTGFLLSRPFQSDADALIFKMKGDDDPGIRIELSVNGEVLYRQRPLSDKAMQCYALDLSYLKGRSGYISVIDSSDKAQICVADFEEIHYGNVHDDSMR